MFNQSVDQLCERAIEISSREVVAHETHPANSNRLVIASLERGLDAERVQVVVQRSLHFLDCLRKRRAEQVPARNRNVRLVIPLLARDLGSFECTNETFDLGKGMELGCS